MVNWARILKPDALAIAPCVPQTHLSPSAATDDGIMIKPINSGNYILVRHGGIKDGIFVIR
jgi:hypothetical protein